MSARNAAEGSPFELNLLAQGAFSKESKVKLKINK